MRKIAKVPIFNGHSDEITIFSINGDGSLLASGDSSGKYCIWEIVSKQCLKVSSMRGSISSLKFVANWPSTSASEHTSTHPMFELKRSITGGEKISMRACDGTDSNKDFWQGEIDRLMADILKGSAKLNSSNGINIKKASKRKCAVNDRKEGKAEEIIVLDEGVEMIGFTGSSPTVCEGASSKSDKELIEKQRQEILKLKKINAELYDFMATELTER